MEGGDDELRITTLKNRIERAQRRIRRYVKPGRSLADELIAERRKAVERSAIFGKPNRPLLNKS
jgi:antitoxin PrlF